MAIKIKKYETSKGKHITICQETSIQSIISDILTIFVIILFMGCIGINNLYLGSSWIINLFFCIMLIMVFVKKTKDMTQKFNTKEDFLKDIAKWVEDE
jgi:hypothetical protein